MAVPRVCVSVPSFTPPRASRPRNIGTYVFTATQKTLLCNIIVIFAENASFRSYGVICLPQMPLTTPKPQNTDTNGIHATWTHDITIRATYFSYLCVHLIHMHAKVFSILIFQYLCQSPPRVFTLVLFILCN